MRIQIPWPSLRDIVGYRLAVHGAIAERPPTHRRKTDADDRYKYTDFENGQADDRVDPALAIGRVKQAGGSHADNPQASGQRVIAVLDAHGFKDVDSEIKGITGEVA